MESKSESSFRLFNRAFIDFLIDNGAPLNSFHLFGHPEQQTNPDPNSSYKK